ncbi:unnamed protein product [Nezara viridula]|uniref:Uncharacterized protein n=1 Tax=Nezara viridula TaxID=85310 RepID=A0A9P0EAK8_NEZVI|nr:unnamed protein product [Nezara viridula]
MNNIFTFSRITVPVSFQHMEGGEVQKGSFRDR